MDNKKIIKLVNRYFEIGGNEMFADKYWLDPENRPFHIWITDIVGDDDVYINTDPEEVSHSLEDSNDDYISFDDAVAMEVQEVMEVLLGLNPYGFNYYINILRDKKSPYKDKKTTESTKVRTFDNNVDENELKWHRDEKDRRVKILECNGWMLQLDNELPVVMKEGKEYFIPKEVFHRTIKGTGNLVIEIIELD